MNRRLLLFTGLGLVAVMVVWYVALWSPAASSLADANDRQARAETEARTLRLDASRTESSTADSEAEAAAAAADILVPDQADLDDILSRLSAAAAQSGLALQSINPSPPTKPTPADPPTVSIGIQVQGSFDGVQAYLAALEKLPRLFVVDSVSISSADSGLGGTPLLSATITGRAFSTQLPPNLTPSSTTPTTAPGSGQSGSGAKPSTSSGK